MAEAPRSANNNVLVGLRGLNNLGNTCFMNSVLQILLKCPPIARFFLADNHNRFECMTRTAESLGAGGDVATSERRPCLACEMDLLFTQCFSGKSAPFSPHSFLQTMWTTVEHFAGYEQQDAHEFLIAALTAIDDGLAMPRRSLSTAAWDGGGSGAWGGGGGRNSGEHPSLAALKGSQPDLARIFTGVLRSEVTCLSCRGKSAKFEEFHDVSLDLSSLLAGGANGGASSCSAEGGASGGDGDPPPPNGEGGDAAPDYHGSLAECLRAFTRAERLSFAERCWCAHCGSLQDSAKQLSFHRLPSVLCFHLKRFRHSAHSKTPSTKIEAMVEFPLHSLNMRPHTSAHVAACAAAGDTGTAAESIEPLPEQLYDLFGVAIHHGGMQNGHYTAYVRSQAEWFHCDDAMVSPAPEEAVRSTKAYLLFYVAKRFS